MTKSELIHRIEVLFPSMLIYKYRRVKRKFFWDIQQKVYRHSIKKLQRKETPINAAFLVTYASIWKYDSLFRLMQKEERFHPFVLVCPCLLVDEKTSEEAMNIALHTFAERGYEVYSLLKERKKCVSLSHYNPDLLFYTRQYAESSPKYDVFHTRKYLKYYVGYGFNTFDKNWEVASQFHGLMWRTFFECEYTRQLALSYEPIEMQNAIVTGYPMYDEFKESNKNSKDWKNQDGKYKRIIWAPHHTIEGQTGMLQLSTFLEYHEIMLQLAEQYKDQVQFVFKPHPILRNVLYRHPNWGKERTDLYYAQWEKGDNTNYVSGAYVDLFMSSDAMIHDCGSFLVEYLYTQKPVMYLASYNRDNQSNQVGKDAFASHYHGYSKEDIVHFIDDVVLGGDDAMIQKRQDFYNQYLLPPNGCSVAENILNDIKKQLGR